MTKTIKNLVLVVLLTALIWAWAEQSQTAALTQQEVTLQVIPRETGVVISEESSDRWSRTLSYKVTADYVGPQSSINKLQGMIRRNEFPAEHTLNLSPDTQDMHQLDLGDVLNFSQPVMRDLHIGASNVRPPRWTLKVSRLRTYTVTVRPQFGNSPGVPRRKEWTIQAELPVALWEKLTPGQRILEPNVEVPPGASSVTIDLGDFHGYRIDPDPLVVAFDTERVPQEFANLEVMSLYPRDFPMAKYRLDSDPAQWRKTIKVSGPRTLQQRDIRVYLEFQMSDIGDTEAKLSRPVQIAVPEGFEIESPKESDPERLIYFKFVEREKTNGT